MKLLALLLLLALGRPRAPSHLARFRQLGQRRRARAFFADGYRRAEQRRGLQKRLAAAARKAPRHLTGVSSGAISVTYPAAPEKEGADITIRTPEATYPRVVAPAGTQKPILIVPELVMPAKRQRFFVHHGENFPDYYASMLGNYNPYFAKMAAANPFFAPFVDASRNQFPDLPAIGQNII